MKVRRAGVDAPVEFIDRGDAHLGSGGLPGVQDLPAHTWPLDRDLANGAVPVVGAAEVVLQLFVDRQRLARTVRAGHDDLLLAVAEMNAIASRGDTVLVGSKPRTRLTEEEIMRAAIAVILVALVTVIAVAAGAIFTIG
jgi:hypothetical protein